MDLDTPLHTRHVYEINHHLKKCLVFKTHLIIDDMLASQK